MILKQKKQEMKKIMKDIKELLEKGKLNVKRAGGKKIDFVPIVQKIIQSPQGWTVKDVHEKLVKGKVTRMRTMKLLNAQCIKGNLTRVLLQGSFYYASAKAVEKITNPESQPAQPEVPAPAQQ